MIKIPQYKILNTLSPRLRVYFLFIAANIFLHTVFWAIFYGFFVTIDTPVKTIELWNAFYIALKFNVRLSFLLLLGVIILSLIPRYNFTRCRAARTITQTYISGVLIAIVVSYIFDFGHYLYLGTRFDAAALRFLDNFFISAEFLWQSYPVVWLTALSAGLSYGFWKLSAWILDHDYTAEIPRKWYYRTGVSIAVFVIVLLTLWGRLSQYPLRWSDAHFSQNKAVVSLSLNPVLYFFDTLDFSDSGYSKPKDFDVHYNVMAKFLGIKNPNGMDFKRLETSAIKHKNPYNVIVIMMESLGSNRVGAQGNGLNSTPNLDKIIEKGVLFDNFYVPDRSTAKSVFTSIFGVPDVSNKETATRNPFLPMQYPIMNDFTGYEKEYFIGGSLTWANIRAVLKKYINNIRLFEGQYESSYPIIDVWGISDEDLFKEAHNRLSKIAGQKKPFFAYIQTAGNHRPFTIPPHSTFKPTPYTKTQLNKNGFVDGEYFRGVQLSDYSLGKFMQDFEKSDYKDNTIIAIFGDHGNTSSVSTFTPPSKYSLNLVERQVPLVLYAPNLLKQKRITKGAGLADMMPTIANLAGIDTQNATLGKNLLDSNHKTVGFVVPDSIIVDNLHIRANGDIHDIKTNRKIAPSSKTQQYVKLAQAYAKMSKYLLHRNEKKQ